MVIHVLILLYYETFLFFKQLAGQYNTIYTIHNDDVLTEPHAMKCIKLI